MGTTEYFRRNLIDETRESPDGELELKFGVTSFRDQSELYIVANGVTVCIDREVAKELWQEMYSVATYLALDRPD